MMSQRRMFEDRVVCDQFGVMHYEEVNTHIMHNEEVNTRSTHINDDAQRTRRRSSPEAVSMYRHGVGASGSPSGQGRARVTYTAKAIQ